MSPKSEQVPTRVTDLVNATVVVRPLLYL